MPTYNAPGVYIEETSHLPPSIVSVPTAIPAFIGYTSKAEFLGESVRFKPQKINSFDEFKTIFFVNEPAPPADAIQHYSPNYFLVPQTGNTKLKDVINIAGVNYAMLPDPSTIYYLYNSVRMFFQNGGGAAYVVSVGPYGPVNKKLIASSTEPLINPNVKLADLQKGLEALRNELEPTLYVCPEACLLPATDNADFMQSMLKQAEALQTAFCIFDVIGGDRPDTFNYTNSISEFRTRVGNSNLRRGACYYPFINTNIMQAGEMDFTNFFGGDISQLQALLSPKAQPNRAVQIVIAEIQKPLKKYKPKSQLQRELIAASPTYLAMCKQALQYANTLPASGAIAGVYKTNDEQRGVWKAPANVSIAGVVDLPIYLNDQQQEPLNVDSNAGKSINLIRSLTGKGILIWGARTLLGNDNEWRYVPVRRAITFIEQSIYQSLHAFVFEPNDANTWVKVRGMIENFLITIWQQGGLQGAKPAEAFSVKIGVGVTMTADDILNGIMRVQIAVAMVRPAEFIMISINQKMLGS